MFTDTAHASPSFQELSNSIDIKAFSLALLYTVGFAVAFYLIWRFFTHARHKIESWHGTVIQSIRIKTLELLPAERISQGLLGALKATRFVLTLSLLYLYVPLVLSLFPRTATLSPKLIGYVLNPVAAAWNGFVDFIPNLCFIIVTIIMAHYTIRFVKFIFGEIERGTLRFSGFYPEWAAPAFQLIRIFIVTFALVVVFPYIPGSSSTAFQGISVFIGVLLSLGSTSAVANIVSGLVLTYMRSFRVGDRVMIASTVGDIVEKSLLVTRIRTVKNEDITIPNSLVLGGHITNYSSLCVNEGLILNSAVTIGYDAPWRKVHDLLIDAALRTPGISRNPAPFVLQSALEDCYVRYQINAYTQNANDMVNIYSRLHQNIQDSFNEGHVEIMSPQFSAIRDGNTVTIPRDQRPSGYTPPSFRVTRAD